jgi:hypothetical protein
MRPQTSLPMRVGIGVIVGGGIAFVDNLAFGGEASPILIVGMLLVFGGAAGMIWGTRALFPAALVWASLPGVHLVKHVFALPDTIHPNTYASILKLGIFSLGVTAIGVGVGLVLHHLFRLRPVQKT